VKARLVPAALNKVQSKYVIYIYAIFTKTLECYVALTSTSYRYLPTEKNIGTFWIRGASRDPEWMNLWWGRSLAQLREKHYVLPDHRLVTIHSELRRRHSKFTHKLFSRLRPSVRKRKQKVEYLNAFISYKILHTRSNLFSQNIIKFRKVRSISYASFSMRNFLFVSKILPANSDLVSIPATGWYLCCCLANPSALHSLSFRQGNYSETPHKQTLRWDERRVLRLKIPWRMIN
jgi:hypothetical protein